MANVIVDPNPKFLPPITLMNAVVAAQDPEFEEEADDVVFHGDRALINHVAWFNFSTISTFDSYHGWAAFDAEGKLMLSESLRDAANASGIG